jgi:hypothetical protein
MTDTRYQELAKDWRQRGKDARHEEQQHVYELCADELLSLEQAIAAAQPEPRGERPTVIGASPVCLDCNAAGIRNCSHFDNCEGKWVYKPDAAQRAPEPRYQGRREEIAQMFHEIYERLAPQFGYETRKSSAKPWSEVPEQNKKLMIATCDEVLERLAAAEPRGTAGKGHE